MAAMHHDPGFQELYYSKHTFLQSTQSHPLHTHTPHTPHTLTLHTTHTTHPVPEEAEE